MSATSAPPGRAAAPSRANRFAPSAFLGQRPSSGGSENANAAASSGSGKSSSSSSSSRFGRVDNDRLSSSSFGRKAFAGSVGASLWVRAVEDHPEAPVHQPLVFHVSRPVKGESDKREKRENAGADSTFSAAFRSLSLSFAFPLPLLSLNLSIKNPLSSSPFPLKKNSSPAPAPPAPSPSRPPSAPPSAPSSARPRGGRRSAS